MKKTIIFFIFSLIYSSSSVFSVNDPTQISKVQETFYEERQWEYLEKIFIEEIKDINSETEENIKTFTMWFSITPLIIFSRIFFDSNNDIWSIETLKSLGLTTITSLISSLIVLGIGNIIYSNQIEREKLVNVLALFLEKHSIETSNTSEIDYKKLIPDELHKTFDTLYKEYKKYGKKYLRNNCLDIIRNIKEKIIYDKKNNKYEAIRQKEIAKELAFSNRTNTVVVESYRNR